MKIYTIEDLKKMTPEQRSILYTRAGTPEYRENGGQAIIDLIDSHGLALSSGALRADDPVYAKMEEIIWSAAGRKAAVEATEKGLPALAGVDPLLSAELGSRYKPHDQGTSWAGQIQAALMRHLGYVESGRGDMPEGSVAKTAMMWKRRQR